MHHGRCSRPQCEARESGFCWPRTCKGRQRVWTSGSWSAQRHGTHTLRANHPHSSTRAAVRMHTHTPVTREPKPRAHTLPHPYVALLPGTATHGATALCPRKDCQWGWASRSSAQACVRLVLIHGAPSQQGDNRRSSSVSPPAPASFRKCWEDQEG